MGCRGVAVWVPASEYGGLILGADWAPVGVSLVEEPGGAAQGGHICVHLQRIHLPEFGGWEKLGGLGGEAKGGRETGSSGKPLHHTDGSSAHIHAMRIRWRGPVITSESQTLPKSQSTAWMMSDKEYGTLWRGAADPPFLVIQRQHVFYNGQMDATLTCKHWRHACCTDCPDVTDKFLEGKNISQTTNILTISKPDPNTLCTLTCTTYHHLHRTQVPTTLKSLSSLNGENFKN